MFSANGLNRSRGSACNEHGDQPESSGYVLFCFFSFFCFFTLCF
jgi:hypothetical protein